MKRLIVLDTETTGLNPTEGDRIIEIGCVELLHTRKGEQYHTLIQPDRDIPAEAVRIHGITNERVANAPRFADIVDSLLAFIGTDTLVIHNASFDIGFLNAELKRLQREPLEMTRVVDTMLLSRRKFPGMSASLDALCRRLKVDNSHRTLHGALLDAHLLAEVYVELTGGNQLSLDLSGGEPIGVGSGPHTPHLPSTTTTTHPPRTWPLPAADQQAHASFLERLQQESGHCIWLATDPEPHASAP
ncbi:MAG: DNA polymerase III subunit epsilon [Magnetococcales bacterium]|nr:DNA polymerase III subunit epsilon [Magnetococcales bacterium]